MADATCFNTMPNEASRGSRPCQKAAAPSRIFIPNTSTQGPHTSSAVQVNLANFMAGYFTEKFPANRVRSATASGYVSLFYGQRRVFCQLGCVLVRQIPIDEAWIEES